MKAPAGAVRPPESLNQRLNVTQQVSGAKSLGATPEPAGRVRLSDPHSNDDGLPINAGSMKAFTVAPSSWNDEKYLGGLTKSFTRPSHRGSGPGAHAAPVRSVQKRTTTT